MMATCEGLENTLDTRTTMSAMHWVTTATIKRAPAGCGRICGGSRDGRVQGRANPLSLSEGYALPHGDTDGQHDERDRRS